MREEQLARVRRICASLPETSERLSHGAPTFFARKRVYCMFANNHHNDGHVAVWIPKPPGVQEVLVATFPRVYFRPPYVGPSGWVGIELGQVGDEELAGHLAESWRFILDKQRKPARRKPASC